MEHPHLRLFLVRHAQTEWNSLARAQGHTDIPLDEAGLRQARRLGEYFATDPVKAVYSSDLKRSLQTAEAIAESCNVDIIRDVRLRERSFGEWEGLPFEELRENYRVAAGHGQFASPGSASEKFTPPGGESLHIVWQRLASFVDEFVQEQTEDAVIVSHGGANGMLMAQFVKGNLPSAASFRFANASITEFEFREGVFRLTRYNDVSHLHAPALQGDLH